MPGRRARQWDARPVRYALLLDLSGPLTESVGFAVAAEDAGLDAVYAIEGGREAFVPFGWGPHSCVAAGFSMRLRVSSVSCGTSQR